jgi:signal recognition particle subunit SRP54
VVREFANRVDFDGVIMSKLDGDARGGGALSVREVTGKPIMFASMGEKPDSLEVFSPDRMAKRILGMGDVVGIIEQAEKIADEQSIADAERMLRQGFTMDDMLTQMQQIRKMGGLNKLIGMLPGGDRAIAQSGGNLDEKQITRIEAMIRSMTKEERLDPKKINGQRRKRIAAGSGRTVQEVNQLLKQWKEMDKMMGKMRQMANGFQTGGKNNRKARRQLNQMMRNMGGGGNMGGNMGGFPF